MRPYFRLILSLQRNLILLNLALRCVGVLQWQVGWTVSWNWLSVPCTPAPQLMVLPSLPRFWKTGITLFFHPWFIAQLLTSFLHISGRHSKSFPENPFPENLFVWLPLLFTITIVRSNSQVVNVCCSMYFQVDSTDWNRLGLLAEVEWLLLLCRNLFKEWTVELKGMADRIINMRHQLYDALQERGALLILFSLWFRVLFLYHCSDILPAVSSCFNHSIFLPYLYL